MQGKPTLVITGISGYVGSQVAKHFLQTQQFKVRGTVRSTKNEEKLAQLEKAFAPFYDDLELVEADLNDAESIHRACEGQTYLIHTASPYQLAQPKDENELIKPAVAGTMAAMEGAKKHGVKRVVITGSAKAIYHVKDQSQTTFTVNDWTYTGKGAGAYEKSKTFAEKAAWEFLEQLPEEERFELVVINPGMILGPNLIPGGFQSGQILVDILTGKHAALPDFIVPFADIRDVAKAHVNAILRPEAAGHRFMLAQSYQLYEIGNILFAEYEKFFPKCSHGIISKTLIWLASWVDRQAADFYQNWGKKVEFKYDETKEILGIDFIDPKKTVLDMVPTLVEHGQVQPLNPYNFPYFVSSNATKKARKWSSKRHEEQDSTRSDYTTKLYLMENGTFQIDNLMSFDDGYDEGWGKNTRSHYGTYFISATKKDDGKTCLNFYHTSTEESSAGDKLVSGPDGYKITQTVQTQEEKNFRNEQMAKITQTKISFEISLSADEKLAYLEGDYYEKVLKAEQTK